MTNAVTLRDLKKTFRTRMPSAPWRLGSLRGLVSRRYTEFRAVDGISFSIEAGERVAFIGPNGAGKSTTLKILSGILHPGTGEVRVLDLKPAEDRMRLAYRIGTVFGQRTQPWQHLPAVDTFRLLARVYDLSDALFRSQLEALVDALCIELRGVRVLDRESYKLRLEVDIRLTPVARVVGAALSLGTLRDLTVEDPPLEQVIQAIYTTAGPETGEPLPPRELS